VDVLLTGTGGAAGWPEPGCRCASCGRAAAAGISRAPGRVLVDGLLGFPPRPDFQPGTRSAQATEHRIRQLPGGFDITGRDGSRLLLAAGPGAVPEPPDGCQPYDLALLDLLGDPAQLGLLRSAGLVQPTTTVVALYTDHRVSSEQEMARRCALWRAMAGQDGQLIASPAPGVPAVIPAPGGGATRPHRTLLLGGARSGKSTEAELRLAGEPDVTYLAAGPWAGQWLGPDGRPDAEWAARVARHRARRPAWWRTVESLDLAAALATETGALLIDGIGTWLAAVMDEARMWAEAPAAGAPAEQGPAEHGPGPGDVLRDRIQELVAAWRQTSALVVAVTDQVGSGLVPAYPAGRTFRDELGWLNQRLAAESELNLLVVAGRVMTLPG
jgi:adenosylcobinamide kinase / adenosylcobinamide-phosphate guanylyltransferase